MKTALELALLFVAMIIGASALSDWIAEFFGSID